MGFKVTRGGFDGNFRSGPGRNFTTRMRRADSLVRSNPFLARGVFHFAVGVVARSPTNIASAIHDFLRQPLNAGRPDADGYLTWREANDWYRHGNGQPLTVDLSKINLKGISAADFGNKVNKEEKINLLFRLLKGKNHSINDGLVYGTIPLKYMGGNRVVAGGQGYDTYNFDIKPWNGGIGSVIRNLETIAGKWNAEVGRGFKIKFKGEGEIGR